jgi:hypothetical protein
MKRFLSKTNLTIFPFISAFAFFVSILESYKYIGFFQKHFLIPSDVIYLLSALSFTGLIFPRLKRVIGKNKFLKIYCGVGSAVFFITLLLYIVLNALETIHFPNFIYGYFHIQPAGLIYSVALSFEAAFIFFITFVNFTGLSKSRGLKQKPVISVRQNYISKRPIRFRFFKISLLIVIPLLVFFAADSFKRNSGPYWMGTNLDPAYAYLLNSLNLTQFKQVAYTDHPGTTLEVLGAIVIEVVHWTRGSDSVVNDVLRNPELYLGATSTFILFFLVVSVFVIGVLTLFLTGSFLFALIIQATPFLSATQLTFLSAVTPESLLLIVGLWFSFAVLYICYKQHRETYFYLILLSTISGFLIATKVNSVPLIIIPLVFLRWKSKILYLLGTGVCFVFFTLPMSHRYNIFFQWILNLIIHSGKYGQGDSNIINLLSFLTNLKTIFLTEQFLSASVIVIGTYIFIALVKKHKIAWSVFLFGLFLFYVLDIALVAKHFDTHYLIPALATLGVSWVLLLSLLKPDNLVKFVISVFILIFAGYNFSTFMQSTKGISEYYQQSVRLDDFVNRNFGNATKVTYYSFSSIENALDFGNTFAGNLYDGQLSQIYPAQYFYNLLTRKFSIWGKETPLPQKGVLIFEGPRFEGGYLKYKPPLNLIDVFGGNVATVYLVKYDAQE